MKPRPPKMGKFLNPPGLSSGLLPAVSASVPSAASSVAIRSTSASRRQGAQRSGIPHSGCSPTSSRSQPGLGLRVSVDLPDLRDGVRRILDTGAHDLLQMPQACGT